MFHSTRNSNLDDDFVNNSETTQDGQSQWYQDDKISKHGEETEDDDPPANKQTIEHILDRSISGEESPGSKEAEESAALEKRVDKTLKGILFMFYYE